MLSRNVQNVLLGLSVIMAAIIWFVPSVNLNFVGFAWAAGKSMELEQVATTAATNTSRRHRLGTSRNCKKRKTTRWISSCIISIDSIITHRAGSSFSSHRIKCCERLRIIWTEAIRRMQRRRRRRRSMSKNHGLMSSSCRMRMTKSSSAGRSWSTRTSMRIIWKQAPRRICLSFCSRIWKKIVKFCMNCANKIGKIWMRNISLITQTSRIGLLSSCLMALPKDSHDDCMIAWLVVFVVLFHFIYDLKKRKSEKVGLLCWMASDATLVSSAGSSSLSKVACLPTREKYYSEEANAPLEVLRSVTGWSTCIQPIFHLSLSLSLCLRLF